MLDPRDKRKPSPVSGSSAEDRDKHRDQPGLLYLFAVGKDGVFDVTAKLVRDDEGFYTKLKVNLDDVPMRDYLVKMSLADSKGTREKLDDTQQRMNHREAATYLGIAMSTLYQKVGTGEIPCHKPSGKNMYLKAELDEYIQQKTRKKPKRHI